MLEFLQMCKDNVSNETVNCLVIGDYYGGFSTIMSTLSFAFHMQNKRLTADPPDAIEYYVPFVNIHRAVLEINTDVTFYLTKMGITPDDLYCLEDLDLNDYEFIALINYKRDFGCEFDPEYVWFVFSNSEEEYDFEPTRVCDNVQMSTTSIATCVASSLAVTDTHNLTDDDKLSLKILYDCILYDLGDHLDAAEHPEDVHMLSELEGFIGVPEDSYACCLVAELEDAAQDVSRLNVIQLLTKFNQGSLSSSDGNRIVYISRIPMHVTDLFKIPDFRSDFADFADWESVSVLIVVGTPREKHSKKDQESILIAEFTCSGLYKEISDKLLNDPELKLKFWGGINGFTGKYFKNMKPFIEVDYVKDLVEPLLDQDYED